MFDIALKEKRDTDGLNKNEVVELFNKLNSDEAYPIEVDSDDQFCFAMGFITKEAAARLDFNYYELFDFITDILDDPSKASPDCQYNFDGISIYLSK